MRMLFTQHKYDKLPLIHQKKKNIFLPLITNGGIHIYKKKKKKNSNFMILVWERNNPMSHKQVDDSFIHQKSWW